MTAQRINESQDVRSNSNAVAKYCKEVSSTLWQSIYLASQQQNCNRRLPHTTGAPTATTSAAFPSLLAVRRQRHSWRLNLRADVHQLNTLFSKAFRNQRPRLTLSYVIPLSSLFSRTHLENTLAAVKQIPEDSFIHSIHRSSGIA